LISFIKPRATYVGRTEIENKYESYLRFDKKNNCRQTFYLHHRYILSIIINIKYNTYSVCRLLYWLSCVWSGGLHHHHHHHQICAAKKQKGHLALIVTICKKGEGFNFTIFRKFLLFFRNVSGLGCFEWRV